MTCMQCGSPMRTKRENYRYDASGLPGVTLVGVAVSRCPACGEYEVAIPRVEELHRALAFAVIQKPTRLAGAEIRFLRKYLGWSGADFAKHMGTAPETISRWEGDKVPIGPQADRLLRLFVVTREPAVGYPLERLAKLSDTVTRSKPIRMALRANAWRKAA